MRRLLPALAIASILAGAPSRTCAANHGITYRDLGPASGRDRAPSPAPLPVTYRKMTPPPPHTETAVEPPAGEPALWQLGVGAFQFYDDPGFDGMRLEYRSRRPLLHSGRWFYGLTLGHQEFLMGYAGVYFPLRVGRLVITPSSGIGFLAGGDDTQTSGPLQFRSGLEFAFEIARGQRLGVGIQHVSNGGYSQPNGGADSLFLTYQVAVGR